jgi:hypothetical protein
MAVSQGWSDWIGGWFDANGKILEIIASCRPHLWATATGAKQPFPVEGKMRPKKRYHNTEKLSWRLYRPRLTLSGLGPQSSLWMTRPASPAAPAAALCSAVFRSGQFAWRNHRSGDLEGLD